MQQEPKDTRLKVIGFRDSRIPAEGHQFADRLVCSGSDMITLDYYESSYKDYKFEISTGELYPRRNPQKVVRVFRLLYDPGRLPWVFRYSIKAA
jgi:hypothetical protein